MIGVLGGTFDPVHFGHLRPALEVYEALHLGELRLIPLRQAVHRAPPHADGPQRLAMVRAAVSGQPGFIADGRELARPGGSYTYDTLTSLRAEIGPKCPLCLLLGSDAFKGFLSWHRPHDILALAHLVIMVRPVSAAHDWDAKLRTFYEERRADNGKTLATMPAGRILRRPVTQLDISATRIRALIAAGHSPRFLLPDPVAEMIERAGLYQKACDPGGAELPRRLEASTSARIDTCTPR